MKFKKGDEVEFEYTGIEYSIVVSEPDIRGLVMVKSFDGIYTLFRESNLALKPKTQNWFGIEIDAFDTELPERGERYYVLNITNELSRRKHQFKHDAVDILIMAAGYWLDEEKAKRSAPKMYKRMCEMARGDI